MKKACTRNVRHRTLRKYQLHKVVPNLGSTQRNIDTLSSVNSYELKTSQSIKSHIQLHILAIPLNLASSVLHFYAKECKKDSWSKSLSGS